MKRIRFCLYFMFIFFISYQTIHAIVIKESFDSNNGFFSSADSTLWSIKNDRLFFHDPNGKADTVQIIFAEPPSQTENYLEGSFSGTVLASVEGGDNGYVYGLQAFCFSSNAFIDDIRIAITTGIYRVDKNSGLGEAIVDWTQDSMVTGNNDELKIERNNNTLKFYINSKQVATYDFPTCEAVFLALFSSSNVEASFDDFTMTFSAPPLVECYMDFDGDGYGNPISSIKTTTQPSGCVSDKTDCDDANATIYPGATEIAGDGIDQDCNGVDEVALDAPILTVTTVGTNVTLSWSSIAGATAYTLFYAPYPNASPIGQIDMGTQTSFSFDATGYAFYVAIKAYLNSKSSEYSNIGLFNMLKSNNAN